MQYGLIGCPLGHSFSKEIHEALGRYSYELCELKPDEVATFLRRRDFRAINVTIPHKQTVMPYLDEISDRAKAIGAVNTIVNRNGRLWGDNTDKTAFAVAAALGAKSVRKVSRSGKDGALTYEQAYQTDANVILNTTPCGMFPHADETPIDVDRFSNLTGVFDAIYHPLCTRLVLDAKERKIPAAGGLYMLVAQAVRAAERFTGEAFPAATLDRVYRRTLAAKRNPVLIGMPGVGKTRVGMRLAELLERPFFDSDRVILERIGMPIADYFAAHGEAAFRAIESEVTAELSQKSGVVLSTGGGAVLKPENVRALKANGFLLFLDRPVDELKVSDDRPLSSDRERVRKLFAERYPIYLAAADVHIHSGKNANETAHMILEELE